MVDKPNPADSTYARPPKRMLCTWCYLWWPVNEFDTHPCDEDRRISPEPGEPDAPK
jgi:hypothetical protein